MDSLMIGTSHHTGWFYKQWTISSKNEPKSLEKFIFNFSIYFFVFDMTAVSQLFHFSDQSTFLQPAGQRAIKINK